MWTLYEGDCFDHLPLLEEDSVDLIILDPPYNIRKAGWDCIGTHEEYLEFIKDVMVECERVLRDNGSLYLWHNQFPTLCDFQGLINRETSLIFKQLIVWDKWNNDIKRGNDTQGAFYKIVHNPSLRNYPKICEYLLFYTFQDETGLKLIEQDQELYKNLREYCLSLRDFVGYSRQKMIDTLGNGRSQHFLEPLGPQWQLCTEETYNDLIHLCFIDKMEGFREYGDLRREYEDLRMEYEDLRREYEDLRYTFNQYNNQTSVWCYPVPNTSERVDHPTQKPVSLCENIIRHSSNPGDIVLIPFAGSGSEMIASVNLNRNVIGIEREPEYCQIIRNRLNELNVQTKLKVEAK